MKKCWHLMSCDENGMLLMNDKKHAAEILTFVYNYEKK